MPAQIGYFDTLKTSSGDTVTVNDTCSIGGAALNNTLPAFFAYNSATDSNVTGTGQVVTVDFDTEVYDQASNFASDTFTAPVTGLYDFKTLVDMRQLDANMVVQLAIAIAGTSAQSYLLFYGQPYNITQGGILIMGGSCQAKMTATDTATVELTVSNGAGQVVDIYGGISNTYFSGRLVC